MWLTIGLVFCLLCTIGMTSNSISGDILKGIMTISICLLIHFINK
jgi:hypothetical protein